MKKLKYHFGENIDLISKYISNYQWIEIKDIVKKLSVPEICEILENLEKKYWSRFYRILPINIAQEVFVNLDPYVSSRLIKRLTDNNLKEILSDLSPDDRSAFFEELPGIITRKLFGMMSKEEVIETRELLGYPEDSVGRMMTPDYFWIEKNKTVDETIVCIRKESEDKEIISVIYVVDDNKSLIGFITLKRLMIQKGDKKIEEIMDNKITSLKAYQDQEDGISLFQAMDLPAIPVTDSNNILIGIITFDDIFDVVEEETTEDIQKSSAITPLEFKYMHTSFFELFRKRVGWLLFLLITASISTTIISHFRHLLQSHITLSFFIPLLIGAGGNTGAQSSTLIIRAISLGDIRLSQWRKAFFRELFMGICLGSTLGVALFVYSYLLYPNHAIAWITGISMIFLIIWANIIGAMLPLIITKLKFDPAIVSNPFLATLVDAMGLIIYFSIALSFL